MKGGEQMLELYENIKRLRKEKKMSQEKLARLTGYTDRSSIAKIEKGDVDIPQSKIMLFAQALGVDAGALMGADGVTDTLQDNNSENINDTFNEIFPKRLTYYMNYYKMSQRALAEKMDVSEATVSNWVKGVKSPRIDKVDRLCELFNCRRVDLIEEPQGMESEFINNYRQLDKESQETVESLIRLLQAEQPDSDRVLEMIRRLSAILHS